MSRGLRQNEPLTCATVDVAVRRIEPVASRVVAIEMEPISAPLFSWTPGSHVDIQTAVGCRSYSLCGDPSDSTYLIAVQREESGRGGSVWIHDEVRVGHQFSIRRPINNFSVLPAKRYLFIAGGIGITPLVPMIEMVDAAGAEWELVYAARNRESMAFCDRLGRHGRRVRLWADDTAGLPPVETLLPTDGEPMAVYCCGPNALMTAVEARCQDIEAVDVYTERFQASTDTSVGKCDSPFEVVLEPGGKRIQVAAGQSLLDALETAGAMMAWSCRQGLCGTCEVRVLAGQPDHRDEVLYPEEREANNRIITCVSRALSDTLTLEV
jgi:ferredoxin-NADP reductase